ncbi:Cytochrome P450 2J3 [Chionoecetes opilio]|uniref:Cytochrome P450 2J3 n=1 Tax=Chionoecetes opilio TaxID=41210 RepID=A0A8J4XZ40_CHIOP|nr:Cytochrome P450 2J3 [Chionoecetes opilio]
MFLCSYISLSICLSISISLSPPYLSLCTVDHLKANILELFLAGSETTSSTLWWAVFFLASNPQAQQTMQEEMDRVVGRDNTPALAHIYRLPYTMATISEVQRIGNLLPFAIPHKATEDVSLGGYRIPKGKV